MAKALGWRDTYLGNSIKPFLENFLKSEDMLDIDRWTLRLVLEPSHVITEHMINKSFSNYFSIGLDSKIAYDFHQSREENPEKFNNKNGNKAAYAIAGLKSMGGDHVDVKEFVRLWVDGNEIQIPKGIKSIVFMNIQSYAGGTNPWGGPKTGWLPQSPQDGIIEIVGLKGASHMGMVQAGLAKGERVAQGSDVKLEIVAMTNAIFGQVDGEPFLVKAPVEVKLVNYGKAKMLCNKSYKQKIKL